MRIEIIISTYPLCFPHYRSRAGRFPPQTFAHAFTWVIFPNFRTVPGVCDRWIFVPHLALVKSASSSRYLHSQSPDSPPYLLFSKTWIIGSGTALPTDPLFEKLRLHSYIDTMDFDMSTVAIDKSNCRYYVLLTLKYYALLISMLSPGNKFCKLKKLWRPKVEWSVRWLILCRRKGACVRYLRSSLCRQKTYKFWAWRVELRKRLRKP